MRGVMQRQHAASQTSSATRAKSATSARSIAHSPARTTYGAGVAGVILDLQRTAGNQAVGRLLQGPPTREGTQSAAARTRLTVNTPADACEQEADRIADRVDPGHRTRELGGKRSGRQLRRDPRGERQSDLDVAKEAADVARSMVDVLPKDAAAKALPFLQLHDAQMVFVEAVEKFAVERDKRNLTEFIDLVNKHRLAQRKYVPFTEYVAAHWPHKPWEYFAESFRAWRSNRDYMKANMKPLFEFFEKGGHRVK